MSTTAPSPNHDLAGLLAADDSAARLNLYVRMLYSPRYLEAIKQGLSERLRLPQATAAIFGELDVGRVELEQKARVAALAIALARALPVLKLFAKVDIQHYVGEFCDSEIFWQKRGRSLGEHFALFLDPVLRASGRLFLADACRLCGIMAGLTEQPEADSPWPQATAVNKLLAGALAGETFVAHYPMLDSAGALVDEHNFRVLESREALCIVTVLAFGDNYCQVSCGPYWGDKP